MCLSLTTEHLLWNPQDDEMSLLVNRTPNVESIASQGPDEHEDLWQLPISCAHYLIFNGDS